MYYGNLYQISPIKTSTLIVYPINGSLSTPPILQWYTSITGRGCTSIHMVAQPRPEQVDGMDKRMSGVKAAYSRFNRLLYAQVLQAGAAQVYIW